MKRKQQGGKQRGWPFATWQENFWAGVDRRGPDECWPWRRATYGSGYGAGIQWIGDQKKSAHAHRIAWILTNGEIVPPLLVCHRCDNPPCCNPGHLFLGTHRENTLDMFRKGRARPMGTEAVNRVTVDEIRTQLARGVRPTMIATALRVDLNVVTQIRRGTAWNWE